MTNKKPYWGLVAVLMVILLSACATQPAAQPTPVPTATTAPIVITEAPTEPVVEPTATATALPTNTPEPTATATVETVTEEVVQPTAAAVSSGSDIYISLSANTICRTGPATTYPSVASIPAGLRVKAVGRLANDDIYYYIENPDAPETRCWVYGQGATVEGNRSLLAQVEPLPSPTPDAHRNFTITYAGIQQCGDDYAFKFSVENTDDLVWQSIKVRISDVVTKIYADYSANRFEASVDCHLDNIQGDLAKGERVFMTPYNPGHFDYRPYGGMFIIKVTLCSEKYFEGTCLTKQITVNP